MKNWQRIVVIAMALQAGPSGAQTFVFATPEQARAVLTARDEFVRRLSPFDRAARLKTDQVVAEDRYLDFVGASIRSWDASPSRIEVLAAAAAVEERMATLGVPAPGKILLVRTSGQEEGGQPYTRGRAVVLPDPFLARSTDLARVIAHETFHVISRSDASLRTKLYALIGFKACAEPELPPELVDRRITNPDAPVNDHCITVSYGGQQVQAVPVLFASAPRYDVAKGGEFFQYLDFKLALPGADRGPARLVKVDAVKGFFEQVGANTDYVIHPEEILADNFSFRLVNRKGLPQPDLPQRIVDTMRGARK